MAVEEIPIRADAQKVVRAVVRVEDRAKEQAAKDKDPVLEVKPAVKRVPVNS